MTRTIRHALAPAVVAIAVVASAPGVHAAPVHSDTYGYQVTLPENWTRIADADLQATAEAVQNPDGKGVVVFDTAFQPAAHSRAFEYL